MALLGQPTVNIITASAVANAEITHYTRSTSPLKLTMILGSVTYMA
jgi:hypothetical protein